MSQKRSRRDFEAEQKKQTAPYAVYGTPLPPLDNEARDDGTYVPIWKQEVTDERGRKRLHGAFTGGFSAGYFNTVGSKEGWTPSTFVSSRTNRAQNGKNPTQQRPEDFMDEEDIREQEESKQISVSAGQAGFGTVDDPSQQNRLLDIFRPKEDSNGVKLLKRMGWEEGAVIGRNPSSSADTVEEGPVPVHAIKIQGSQGLGCASGIDPATYRWHDGSLRTTSAALKDDDNEDEGARPGLSFAGNLKRSLKKPRAGIAISSLNEPGSDDEDVFSMGPKISYNKIIGGDKKPKKAKNPVTINANPLLKTQPVLMSKQLPVGLSSLRRCHDGRLPLEGFVLGDQLDSFSSISITDHDTRPPEVPSEWKSAKLADAAAPSDGVGTSNGPSSFVPPNQLSTKARSQVLGEQPLPSKSVFDYLSPAARNQLSIATGRTDLPPARNEAAEMSTTAASQQPQHAKNADLPNLDPVTAKAALSKGYMPYSDNLPKQSRYKAFLEYSSDPGGNTTPPSQPEGRTKEEFIAELYEFTRAAQVFKPVSGLMASRFTTSSSSGIQENAGSDDSTSTATLLTKPLPKPADPAEEAAKMGMFGLATRTIANFYPTNLVCKRFGVDMPSA